MKGKLNIGKNGYDWIGYFVLLSGVIAYLVVALMVLNNGFGYNYLVLPIILALFVFLCIKNKKKISRFLKNNSRMVTIVLLIIVIIGFIVRFSFLFLQDRFYIAETLSDTGVHWYGSQQLINEGQFDAEIGEYERLYPYLSAYTGVLSVSKSVFGDNYFAILFLNIVFDVISCVIIYILFYVWKRNKNVALFASAFWAVNPLQIVFCGLPLAIVIVNAFVVSSILVTYLLFRYRDSLRKVCILSAVCGMVFAMGNAFRPVFVIFLLATIVYWIFLVLAKNEKIGIKKPLMSCLIMAAVYLVIGVVPGVIHMQFNSYYHGEKARSGWGVYVGSNYETKGVWSRNDSDLFFGSVLEEQANGDVEQAQSIIMEIAIGRYLDILSDGRLLQHFLNKVSVIFGDIKNSIYDLPYVFNFSKENWFFEALQDAILIFYHLLLFAVGYKIYFTMKKKKKGFIRDGFVNYLIILFVGLFLAFLLVEAMNRYCLPFVAILMIVAIGISFQEKRIAT